MTPSGIEVHALEAFADLLFALDSAEPNAAFYDRLCEATCRLAGMDRAAIFLYDPAARRVRAVGSHGIELRSLQDVHATAENTPIALRALNEDRVVEVRGDAAGEVPDQYLGLASYPGLVCTPISAAGRKPGVILSDRADPRPLTDEERHLLWTLGKIAALAASARLATREQERARQLEDRIDLAREIHDGVIQRLFGVSMALSVGDLPAHVEPLAQSVLTEALRNASKHASPTRVGVSVGRQGDAFMLEVVNDGVRSSGERSHIAMGLRLAAFEALHHGGVMEFGAHDDDQWR